MTSSPSPPTEVVDDADMQAQTANDEQGVGSVTLIIIVVVGAVFSLLLAACLVRLCRRGAHTGKDGHVVVTKPPAAAVASGVLSQTHGGFEASASSMPTADISGIDLYEMMDKGVELSAVAPEQPSPSVQMPQEGSSQDLFPVGATVLVKRSSGGETEATIISYNPNKAMYTVAFEGGKTKTCHVAWMREVPPKTMEDGQMADITSL